jgi:predicted dehydrogenase
MVRAMIVGVGRWGRTLIDSVQGVSDKITFFSGLKTTISAEEQAYADAKGMKLLTCSLEEALARDDFDAVVLCSPHSIHAEQIAIAAAAGKPIACEKPFTLTAAEARASTKAAKDAGVLLAVLHNRRFNPVYQEIQRILRGGSLGKISHIEANFSGDSAIKNQVEVRPWRSDPVESPLGSMTNRGVHALDAMVGCCGPIEKVFATAYSATGGVRDDTTACMLWFKNGMTGYLGTLNATTSFWHLKVFGFEGTVEMRGLQELVIHMRDQKPEIRMFDAVDIERAELEAFADAVNGVASYPMTFEEMEAVPAFLEAAVKSAETGQVVATN